MSNLQANNLQPILGYNTFHQSFSGQHTVFSGKYFIYSNRHTLIVFTLCLQIIQALYFIIALTNDFIGSNELNPKNKPLIRKVKDYTFASLVFPAAFNVGITFWGLYAVDRELVFPKVLDAVFPS